MDVHQRGTVIVADVTPIDRKRRIPLTDLGNGERLAARHGADLHYVTVWKSWLIWDGRRWQRDDTCELERRAKKTVRAIWDEAKAAESSEDREKLAKHALTSESNGRVRAMVECARSEPGIAIRYQEFDTHPFLLNVRNGTLDLSTGELRKHQRDDLLTKLTDVEYQPTAECPLWLQFLDQTFEGDTVLTGYLQRAVGYSLTGDTREQCLHLMYGTGSNGKSTFLEVLQGLLGDYGVQADFATFVEKKGDGPRNDVARLAGARMVRSSEVGEGKRLNESLVKSLTGQDTIAARFLYSEAFEFQSTFKLWLAANHKPVIRGTDHAIWRRVRLVPFTVTVPDDKKDETLKNRLLTELPGILRWAVEGCAGWLESGLRPPEVVLTATQAYRSESDVIGTFLDECCELSPKLEVSSTELYLAYKHWAKTSGEYELSQRVFGLRLQERGFVARKEGVIYRQGLRLLPNAVPKDEQQWWQK
jgi:putative DNA primase/helicase